jgi:Mn-containing catalase
MFYHEGGSLQYPVEVESPNPEFARMLQQAIGGVEGEVRVALQYMAQAAALPTTDEMLPYRHALMDTAAEEFGHVEMLATAVNKNLEDASTSVQEDVGVSYQPRQFLSSGMHALYTDANGVPFSGNYPVASGNIAADMVANVAAESTGRTLATRLYEATDDPGMQDMLAYLIARDTMHQNQWLQMLQDLGDPEDPFDVFPIPDSLPDGIENQEFNYAFLSTNLEEQDDPGTPWTGGTSVDDEGEFSFISQHDLEGFEPKVEPGPEAAHNDPTPMGEDELVGDGSGAGGN